MKKWLFNLYSVPLLSLALFFTLAMVPFNEVRSLEDGAQIIVQGKVYNVVTSTRGVKFLLVDKKGNILNVRFNGTTAYNYLESGREITVFGTWIKKDNFIAAFKIYLGVTA